MGALDLQMLLSQSCVQWPETSPDLLAFASLCLWVEALLVYLKYYLPKLKPATSLG